LQHSEEIIQNLLASSDLGVTFQVAIRSREQRFFSGRAAVAADAFDRRIVTLLAFGPVATLFLMSLLTGRDTVPLRG
jgi:hypothetical protein